MGFWNELLKVYDTPSKLSGKGMFWITKALTGSDKNAAAAARIGEVAGAATIGDPTGAFRQRATGADYGIDETKYRKGRQAADWLGAILGTATVGGMAAGGAWGAGAAGGESAAAGGGGATITGGSGATGMELETAAGTGQGAWSEPASGGFNWQNLLRQSAGKMNNGYQQGSGVSISSLIAQQQAEEAARRSQEMLGGDSNLIDYMARMQMQNNLRRAG